MHTLNRYACTLLPVLALAACGGGSDDFDDRSNLADPAMRFVHAAPGFAELTLARDADATPEATNAPYKFASDYFDIATDSARWSIRSANGSTTYGSFDVDPAHGEKYTMLAVQHSATTAGAALIRDPFDNLMNSSTARLRLMQAAFNTGRVDVYMNLAGTNIEQAGVEPLIAGTDFNTAGPPSGSNAADITAGTYQITITQSGTKTVLFRGELSFDASRDVLLVTVPAPSFSANCIRTLVKIDKALGAVEITPVAPPSKGCMEAL